MLFRSAGVGLEDKLSAGGFDDPGTESARELALERSTFGNRSIDAIVIFSSDDEEASAPEFRAEVERTVATIPQDSVVSVLTWYDVQDPAMVSKDGHATAVYVSLAGDSQNDFIDSFDEMRPAVEKSSLHTELAGPYAVYTDVNEETKSDLLRAELVSMPIVLVLSLIIFRSVVAALMPLLVGLVAVLGARATIAGLKDRKSTRLNSSHTDISRMPSSA